MAGSHKAASISALIHFHGVRDGTRRRFVSKLVQAARQRRQRRRRRRRRRRANYIAGALIRSIDVNQFYWPRKQLMTNKRRCEWDRMCTRSLNNYSFSYESDTREREGGWEARGMRGRDFYRRNFWGKIIKRVRRLHTASHA